MSGVILPSSIHTDGMNDDDIDAACGACARAKGCPTAMSHIGAGRLRSRTVMERHADYRLVMSRVMSNGLALRHVP